MSVSIPEDIQGLDQANAELDRLFAADAAGEQSQVSKVEDRESAQAAEEAAGQRAAQTEGDKTQAGNQSTVQSPQSTDKGTEATEQPPEKKSRYAKAVERQEKSWSELNAQKEALKREREEFDRAKQEHQARLAEAEKDFSPEAYDQAAQKFEDAGKFDLAELAREKAAELRKPGARSQQPGASADALAPQRKEWALKAGVDFPELAKANSALQLRVAQLLKEEPDLKSHPKGIYMAARLADLEARCAGVADKDKELDGLRAKVKDLEGLTAPGGGGVTTQPAPKTFEQLSDTEQYEQLAREAQELGALR